VITLLATLASCGGQEQANTSAEGTSSSKSAERVVLASQATEAKRDVIYTATLVVRTSSVPKATEQASAIAEKAGGFVFAANTTVDDDTTMTIRVPSVAFDATMDKLAGLGRELQRDIKAQDVTADVVDVEGRLKTAQTSADRLRTLLSQSTSAPDILAVEAELAKREAEIESQQGRLRVLNDQVALATVRLRLTKRNAIEVSKDLPGFLGGLRAGVVAVVNVAQGLLVVLGFLLPFGPFIAAAIWLLRRYRRRHRRRGPSTAPPPTWPQQPVGSSVAAGGAPVGEPQAPSS
jgi:hypothetical protein